MDINTHALGVMQQKYVFVLAPKNHCSRANNAIARIILTNVDFTFFRFFHPRRSSNKSLLRGQVRTRIVQHILQFWVVFKFTGRSRSFITLDTCCFN